LVLLYKFNTNKNMSEIQKIEKIDIQAPLLQAGESAIVFQRHERYNRDRNAVDSGSLAPEHADAAYRRDVEFFDDLLSHDSPESGETMVLFVSSDTQYAGRGYRSMETAQLAQRAAAEVMTSRGIDPIERIINFNPDFKTDSFVPTGQSIRPDKKIREPQIFDTPGYVDHLRNKYGGEDGPGAGISPKAWAMHEMDAEKEMREQHGAEGVHEMLGRTKQSLALVERYAKMFHANNPNKKLVVWMASHYDTLSPLVKDAQGMSFEEYVPVDYGAGVVIELGKDDQPMLAAQGQRIALDLGQKAVNA
jgi:hypothetical protein